MTPCHNLLASLSYCGLFRRSGGGSRRCCSSASACCCLASRCVQCRPVWPRCTRRAPMLTRLCSCFVDFDGLCDRRAARGSPAPRQRPPRQSELLRRPCTAHRRPSPSEREEMGRSCAASPPWRRPSAARARSTQRRRCRPRTSLHRPTDEATRPVPAPGGTMVNQRPVPRPRRPVNGMRAAQRRRLPGTVIALPLLPQRHRTRPLRLPTQ